MTTEPQRTTRQITLNDMHAAQDFPQRRKRKRRSILNELPRAPHPHPSQEAIVGAGARDTSPFSSRTLALVLGAQDVGCHRRGEGWGVA